MYKRLVCLKNCFLKMYGVFFVFAGRIKRHFAMAIFLVPHLETLVDAPKCVCVCVEMTFGYLKTALIINPSSFHW